jgi:hypothetical protein
MRLLYVAAVLGAFGMGEASAEDNGARLLQIFEQTCAGKPASGAALDASARSLGYANQNWPVAPDDSRRALDDVYFWKLPDQGSKFAIDAYFAGPRAHYRVVCGLHADHVDVAAFVASVKREMKLAEASEKTDAETGRVTYGWTGQTGGGEDVLEVAAFRNGRVSVTLTYDVRGR